MNNSNSSPGTPYTYVWNKYRPAILRLMVDAANGPQQYKFSDHEFRRLSPRKKSGYDFTLHIFKSKATNDIRSSAVAKDLLLILQQSKTVWELTEASAHDLMLDSNFVLHVTKDVDKKSHRSISGAISSRSK